MTLLHFSQSVICCLLIGCAVTTHSTSPAGLGEATEVADILANAAKPGPIEFRAITAAHWAVPKSGLLNLDHPKAVAAGLEDEDEPIIIQFFELRHPTRGLYLIDSGIAADFRNIDTAPVGWAVKQAMNFDVLKVKLDMSEWSEAHGEELRGVFLTHLHLDHVMGLPDLPKRVPLYTGPGEAAASQFLNLFVQGTTDQLLEGYGSIREWRFVPDTGGYFEGVADVFGDGSVFALHVPGHTPGSTAFLLRTSRGPVLVVGDASHTAWGWEHSVEPGSFSDDLKRSASSLQRLKRLEAQLPSLVVHAGHQHINSKSLMAAGIAH